MPRFDIRASKIELQFSSLYRPETFFQFPARLAENRGNGFQFPKDEPKNIPLNLDECKMHVKVPLNAFIVVFIRALDKQTPLSS